MNSFPPISRCVVLMSLLLSVSMASVYPRVAADEYRAEVQQSQAPGMCCCGTKLVRNCGMACCQLPMTKQSTPAPPKTSNDRGQPLGLPQLAIGVTGLSSAALYQGEFRDSSTSGSPSLIALCIRINA